MTGLASRVAGLLTLTKERARVSLKKISGPTHCFRNPIGAPPEPKVRALSPVFPDRHRIFLRPSQAFQRFPKAVRSRHKTFPRTSQAVTHSDIQWRWLTRWAIPNRHNFFSRPSQAAPTALNWAAAPHSTLSFKKYPPRDDKDVTIRVLRLANIYIHMGGSLRAKSLVVEGFFANCSQFR